MQAGRGRARRATCGRCGCGVPLRDVRGTNAGRDRPADCRSTQRSNGATGSRDGTRCHRSEKPGDCLRIVHGAPVDRPHQAPSYDKTFSKTLRCPMRMEALCAPVELCKNASVCAGRWAEGNRTEGISWKRLVALTSDEVVKGRCLGAI